MSQLIEVVFKGNRKEFFVWESGETPALNAPVLVDADRGVDLGRVRATGDLAQLRAAKCTHGPGETPPSRKALRVASAEESERGAALAQENDNARQLAMQRVAAAGLAMKVSDAEWQWDRRKLTLYFTSEGRVDFRALVRELAGLFRTRIELKQIGARDEAKRLDGIGRCGRQYCSASWLPVLRPVNLGVAKDQRLSLNPSQISGACGRLMCCLRYEHEFYAESRKRFPKEGKLIRTSKGEEKVVSVDIFGERILLRGTEGETRFIALEALHREMDVPTVQEEEPEHDDSDGEALEHPMLPTPTSVMVIEDPAQATPALPRHAKRRRGRRGGRHGHGPGPAAGPGGDQTPPAAP